jgi:hypothetical protein
VHPSFFGDSYDIVKHTLLRWLQPLGPWVAHPMFRSHFSGTFIDAYETLIDVPLITREPIPIGRRRGDHLDQANTHKNVLFDPDTGIRTRGKRTRKHLTVDEIVRLARARPRHLTAIFDQSLSRGQERVALDAKIATLESQGIRSLGYYSHACFVFASPTQDVISNTAKLLRATGVPECRLRSVAE